MHFLQYNNAVPLVFGVLFLGATGTYAATNPEAIYNAEEQVLSVDNTYIANKDLSAWTPRVEITGVTEDTDNYYVAYKFTTIDLKEAVWQDVAKEETMNVSKADLGPYRDLGLYVTEQLKQKIGRELARLEETQKIEVRNVSQKMVATAYSGLVGKFLDDTTEVLPGYVPVVTPPSDSFGVAVADAGNPTVTVASGTPAPVSGALALLGLNPSYVPLRANYSDLGAVITDSDYMSFGIHIFVNDTEVPYVQIDTASTSEWRIRYTLRTGAGDVAEVTRRLIVYDPANPPVFEQQTAYTPPAPQPVPEPATPSEPPPAPPVEEPTPTPEPEPTPPVVEEPTATSTPPAPEPEPEPTPEPVVPPPAEELPSETATPPAENPPAEN
jgi:hypothetical protein